MNGVLFRRGFLLEPLQKKHPRRQFDCGQGAVNDWLRTKALQHQEKRLSATKESIVTKRVPFGELFRWSRI